MKKTVFALALAAIGLAQANAAVITFEDVNALEKTELNQSMSLRQFDANLGVLESVELRFFGLARSAVSITNRAANEQFFRFNSVLNLAFTGPETGTVLLTLFNLDTDTPIASGATLNLNSGDVSNSSTQTLTASFADFIGNGSLDFNCRSQVRNTQSGGGGNLLVTQATDAACGARVTYTYSALPPSTPPPTSIPEPGSLMLLGLGLLGMATGLRRKG